MARIAVEIITNEYDAQDCKDAFKFGSCKIKITAVFYENIDEIMAEASERVRNLLKGIPQERQKYSQKLI